MCAHPTGSSWVVLSLRPAAFDPPGQVGFVWVRARVVRVCSWGSRLYLWLRAPPSMTSRGSSEQRAESLVEEHVAAAGRSTTAAAHCGEWGLAQTRRDRLAAWWTYRREDRVFLSLFSFISFSYSTSVPLLGLKWVFSGVCRAAHSNVLR